MTQTEVRERLERLDVRPNRKLGQNFLSDARVAEGIGAALNWRPGDTVVEVGPGLGALSEHLAGKVGHLTLVEFDHRLAAGLEREYAARGDVEVIRTDAVQWDARAMFARRPVHLLGNLPYSCGTAIMRHLLIPPTPFASAVLMLQTEVAQRLMARPRSKDFGVLTLQLQPDWVIGELRRVPPEVFWPRPAVESSVIRLTPRPAGELPPFDRKHYDRLVKQGFAQRRKQVRKALGLEGERWTALAAALGVEETARAEELGLEQWVELSRQTDPLGLPGRAQSGDERFDVVDDADRVIGRAGRDEVHARDLRHRAIHGLVFNRAGDVLLQQRSFAKDRNPGVWDSSISGHLDSGEEYRAAMVREAGEEIGLHLPAEQWLDCGKTDCGPQTSWEFITVFRAEVERAKGLRARPEEVIGLQWFPPAVVDEWLGRRPEDFSPAFRLVWGRGRRGV